MNDYQIILTNDYEIDGRGNGCGYKTLIDPTNVMVQLLEEYDAKMTFFVDVVEIWKFKELEAKQKYTDYSLGSDIEKQLIQLYRKGHDIQLHLHPQWLDAINIDANKWSVNEQHWGLNNLPNGYGNYGDIYSILGLISKGKKYLEELLNSENQNYRCIAYRSGGYAAYPEEEIIRALIEVGIKIDSNFCPRREVIGRKKTDVLSDKTNKSFWRINNKFKEELSNEDGRIVELPLATIPIKLIQDENSSLRNVFRNLRRFFNPYNMNIDICKLSLEQLILSTEFYMKNFKDEKGPIPIVLTGHSKEPFSTEDLRDFIVTMRNNGLSFTTLSSFYDKISA